MSVRKRVNFNSDWIFRKGDIPIQYAVKSGMTGGLTDCATYKEGEWCEIAFVDKKMSNLYDTSEWSEISIPHDWCVEESYVNDSELGSRPGSSGYLPVGIGCYRKEFNISEKEKGSKFLLEFDGIMGISTVWVNGHLIGTDRSGYISLAYDITDVLRYGQEGRNTIFVKVDATNYEGWWYEGCGIYRNIWLTQSSQLHVNYCGTYITTPEVNEDNASIKIETDIFNEYNHAIDFILETEIINNNFEAVGIVKSHISIENYTNKTITQSISIDKPLLWSIESPYLYVANTRIKIGNQIVDDYKTRFGVRTIKFDKDKGFFLNGTHTLIKGTCNHQDFAGLGVALPYHVQRYKIKLLKEMGCNAYRCAHHPPSPELLDICDEFGMMVMDENRKLDSSKEGISNLKSMILRDRNHPSIIIWSMENEELLEGTVMGARILKTLVNITHKLDSTRPALAAMNHGWNDDGYSNEVDIVGYNYGQRESQDICDKKLYPNRKMIGSESASCTTTRGIYENIDIKGYCSSYGDNIPDWGCSLEKAWDDIVNNPFLTGVFFWTGFDYRGEPTPYLWPAKSSHFGIMDICGFPKDTYYFVKSVWTNEYMVHIFPHWNWAGKEGEIIKVVAYSNCEKVEIVFNGKSCGTKNVPSNGHAEWNIPYTKGEVLALGIIDGKVITETKIETTGVPYKIDLSSDESILKYGIDGGTIIKVDILDEIGRVVPNADNEIIFTTVGNCKIIGVGNGDPSSNESDKSNIRRAFNGRCLAIIQTKAEGESAVLKASSPGLIDSEIRFKIVK